MPSGTLRHADPARDGPDCAAIYHPAVTEGAASFEEPPAPDAEAMAGRIAAIGRTHPWLVIEDAGRVRGYAYASPHRTRAAYRWAADVAIYVADDYRRRGAGRRLYLALFELMRGQGLWVACAGIALPNEASVALHEAVGFEPVGIYRGIGWKAGAWRDVGWWQLRLRPGEGDGDGGGDGGGGQPADPRPPGQLGKAPTV